MLYDKVSEEKEAAVIVGSAVGVGMISTGAVVGVEALNAQYDGLDVAYGAVVGILYPLVFAAAALTARRKQKTASNH